MGNRGSKSEFKLVDKRNLMLNSVKEQRLNGSLCGKELPHIRFILAAFERKHPFKFPSNLIKLHYLFPLIFFSFALNQATNSEQKKKKIKQIREGKHLSAAILF
jgi:hypothetical protein